MKKSIKLKMEPFEEVQEFDDGFMIAKGPKNSNLPYAIFDKDGKQITPFRYENIKEEKGMFITSQSELKVCSLDNSNYTTLYGVVNKTGKEVLPMVYQYCIVNDNYIIVDKNCSKLHEGAEVYSKDGDFIEYLPKSEKMQKKFVFPKK